MNSSGSLLKPLADSLMGDSSLWKFGNQMGHQPCIWVLCCTICNCIVIGLMDFKGFKGSLKFGCSFVNKPGFGCDTLKLKWFFFLPFITISILPLNFHVIDCVFHVTRNELDYIHLSSTHFIKNMDQASDLWKIMCYVLVGS